MNVRALVTKKRLIVSGVIVVCASFLLWNPFFEIHRIEGPSMWPAFDPHGEIVIVRKGGAPVRRGELVIVRPDDDNARTYLKRVIGLGGEDVKIENGDVMIGVGPSARPMPRTLDEIYAQSVPVVRLKDLRLPSTAGADALVDPDGTRWIVCEKGSMSPADSGGFLKLGDGTQPTVVRLPDGGFKDDHFVMQKDAVVAGSEPAVDLILTLGLRDAADGTLARVEHQIDGTVVEVFSFAWTKDAVRVAAEGKDACVIARGTGGFGALRLAMVDQRIAVSTAPSALGPFETAHDEPRRPIPRGAKSRLVITVQAGWIILDQLELNRDIVYTSNRGESHFGTREPMSVLRGNVFLLGDNSAESDDGRKWGDLSEGRILGRPVLVIWPFGRMRKF